jgi:hypothetical protein
MVTTGGSKRSPGTMCGKADCDDRTGGCQTRCYRNKPGAVLSVTARTARDRTVLDSPTDRVMPVWRLVSPCDTASGVAHRPWTFPHAWNPSQPVRPRRVPATVGPSQHALALLCLPACDGRRCMAHAAWVKMLLTIITIPSVSTSVNQGSTDFEVRCGLAPLSVSALQGVSCACPATSQPIADGLSRETR